MSAPQPSSRPKNTQQWFIDQLQASRAKFNAPAWNGVTPTIFGCEAYYQSMGNPETNDIGMYDDAMILLSAETFLAVNANLDPSAWRAGHGEGDSKGMATIHYGFFPNSYQIGHHKTIFPALRQAGKLTIRRNADASVPSEKCIVVDGHRFYLETGDWEFCDIHPGGFSGTSSLGCQTIPQGNMWELWISTVVHAMKLHNMSLIDYTKDRVRG